MLALGLAVLLVVVTTLAVPWAYRLGIRHGLVACPHCGSSLR